MIEELSPVPQGNLKDAAYRSLRNSILSGRLPAGTRLNEVEIAQALQISRAPLREAFVHLAHDGLVVHRQNRGTFVTALSSSSEVDELTTLRAALEVFALSLAAARLTPEKLDVLDRVVEKMDEAATAGDLAALAELDFDFHRELCQLSGHQKLIRVWNEINVQYWALYLTSIRYMSGDFTNVSPIHHKIASALRERQIDLATLYLQHNILQGGERVRERLARAPIDDATAGSDAFSVPAGTFSTKDEANGNRRSNE